MRQAPLAIEGRQTPGLGTVGKLAPLALVAMAFAIWALDHIGVYAFSNDEGMPLMWARLMRDGYVLYRDIWADHPPLLQWAMLGIFGLVGEANGAIWGRGLMVLLSAGGVLALGGLAWRASRSHWAGAWAGAALVLSPLFNWFGRAIMPDIPANCLAALAALVALGGRDRLRLAALSGALFGVSLMIKLIALPLAPAVLIALVYGVREWRALLRLVVAWGLGMALVIGVVAAFLDVEAATRQIIGTVVGAREARAWEAAATWDRWWEFLADGHIGLVGLALLGSGWSLQRRTPGGLTLLAWLILATLSLSFHYPLYEHHLALALFPLAGLAGVGAAQLVQPGYWRWGAAAALLAYGLAFPLTWPETFLPSTPNDAENWEMVTDLQTLSPPRGWIVTDSTLLAFHAGLRIPPPLITGGKRLESGLLTDATLITETARWQPTVIAFVRSEEPPRLPYLSWVEHMYRLSKRYSATRRLWSPQPGGPQIQLSSISLGEGITLAGYSLAQPLRAADADLPLGLFWTTTQILPVDLEVKVTLVAADGRPVGQPNSDPVEGATPPAAWAIDRWTIDMHRLRLTPPLAAGDYWLDVGLYRPSDGRPVREMIRLPEPLRVE